MTNETPEQQPVDDEGRTIEPGDFVISLGPDGVPEVYTEPEKEA